MSTIPLYIAITKGDGVFKQWGLFIDDENQKNKTVLQVKGSDGQFRYEPETKDARRSPDIVDLIYVCNVDVMKANDIKRVASEAAVHNDISGWNCQDYVLDLMELLEETGVLDGSDEEYRRHMDFVRGIQEGLA
ncbi:uncharacterized protein N7484_008979 [Penicillium longicatenatum]|uniref:uncharacterized protein n=1 Tax=Penicillium longicatenatum TaxID=1561947 RepID=UPI0025490F0A|nr:uncharacterized protein N7484_008979 [Penicillium longicatenatum]KAJ5635666.1 hypothetical protein N7484_008979 [Penicillium longicatenatum]